MTINDLLKQIPENKRDYFVVIYLPFDVRQVGIDRDTEPLIEITIDDNKKQIILEADTN